MSCLSVKEKGEGFTNMDSHIPLSTVTKPERSGCSRCLSCLTAVAVFVAVVCSIGGLILGAYAVSKTNTIDKLEKLSNVFLTSDISNLPNSYSAYPLQAGVGYWAAKSDLAYARSDFGAQPHGHYVVVFGGSNNGTGAPINATVMYDTASANHYQLADMLVPISRFAHAILDGVIYVFGGTTVYGGEFCETAAYKFDIALNRWSLIRPLEEGLIDGAATVGSDGKIYIIGGYLAPNYTIKDTVVQYDPVTNTYVQLIEKLNVPRGDARAVTVGTKLYVLGGFNWLSQPGDSALSSVEMMDLATLPLVWTQVASMNKGRGDFAAGVLSGGRIVVAGGERDLGDGLGTQYAMDDVEVFIPDSDQWLEKASLPEARFRVEGAVVNNHFYVLGGTQTCVLDRASLCFEYALKSVFSYMAVDSPLIYVVTRVPAAARRLLHSLA